MIEASASEHLLRKGAGLLLRGLPGVHKVIGEIEAALLDKAGAENVETTKRTLRALIEILNAKGRGRSRPP